MSADLYGVGCGMHLMDIMLRISLAELLQKGRSRIQILFGAASVIFIPAIADAIASDIATLLPSPTKARCTFFSVPSDS